jgi:hypothetical protein
MEHYQALGTLLTKDEFWKGLKMADFDRVFGYYFAFVRQDLLAITHDKLAGHLGSVRHTALG